MIMFKVRHTKFDSKSSVLVILTLGNDLHIQLIFNSDWIASIIKIKNII